MYNYQPYMPYQQQMPIQQPIQEEKIYVSGEEGAKAYLVARGEFVRLWDDKENIFYEKRADQSGRPSIDIFRYEKVDAKDHMKSLEDRISALESIVRGDKNAKSNIDEPDK